MIQRIICNDDKKVLFEVSSGYILKICNGCPKPDNMRMVKIVDLLKSTEATIQI